MGSSLRAFGVRTLCVEGNMLRSFNPLLCLLSLEKLHAADNRAQGDVSQLFTLKRLRYLDVSNNRLTLRRSSLPLPQNLEFVDASGNCGIMQMSTTSQEVV